MSDVMPLIHEATQPLIDLFGGDPVVLLAIVGGILLVAGARLYRLAVVAPGLVGGVLIGAEIMHGADPIMRLVAAIGLAAIGAVLMLIVERVSISVTGAFLLSGITHAAAPILLDSQPPWYVPVAAAVVGLLLFPKLFRSLLFVLTSLGGALCLAWAMDRSQELPLICGMWTVGIVIQWIFRPGKKS